MDPLLASKESKKDKKIFTYRSTVVKYTVTLKYDNPNTLCVPWTCVPPVDGTESTKACWCFAKISLNSSWYSVQVSLFLYVVFTLCQHLVYLIVSQSLQDGPLLGKVYTQGLNDVMYLFYRNKNTGKVSIPTSTIEIYSKLLARVNIKLDYDILDFFQISHRW